MDAIDVRERGILFKPEMILRLLDGRKTMTRRLVKPQPFTTCANGGAWTWVRDGQVCLSADAEDPRWLAKQMATYCPYPPGSRPYVKERFIPCNPSGPSCKIKDATYVCFVDGTQVFKSGAMHEWGSSNPPKWEKGYHRFRSSLHMPKWAARIWLEVTAVRVERVNRISREDCIAEGIADKFQGRDVSGIQHEFAALWDSIHGAGAFNRGEWTWVISFRRLANA